MDIKPPIKRTRPQQQPMELPKPTIQPVDESAVNEEKLLTVRRRKPIIFYVFVWIVGLLLAVSLGLSSWYLWAIGPKSHDSAKVRIVIEPGETAATIASTLANHQLIRSRLAFNLYTHFTNTRGELQAGGYALSSNMDMKAIVEHITSGKTDEFNVRILPGFTLKQLADPKMQGSLAQQGFSVQEIDAAYTAPYKSPLLASRPAGASLEGYLYPETYRMYASDTAETLFSRSFDEMYKIMQQKGYLSAFAKEGLSIHQAVTLASVVQKEVMTVSDQKQVAQVFLKRLSMGIPLGSDVTYMYAADQLGVKASPNLDSPYNTRKYAGLPPGPIANMNLSALDAVAFPASGDYLFFVAGDGPDAGKTFFSHTEAEHEANVAAHCHELCR